MPDAYPSNTQPHQNDTEEESLHKILKVLDEAKTGTRPLATTGTLPSSATQAEAEAGMESSLRMFSPQRIAQAIAALGGSGGGSCFTLKSADFNSIAGKSYAVDTSGGVVTATLPATPIDGDVIEFADAASTWNDFNLILAPNGEKVFGRTSNFSLKKAAILATVVYVDGERGWSVFSGMSVPVLVTAPAFSGTETEFQTLTATPGTWTNASTEYRYQWQISANGTTGWSDITGATSSTYVLAVGDGGKFVRVTVIATNSASDSDAEPSSPSGEIVVLPVPANTAVPTISGNEAKGATLTGTSGTWENGTPTYAYQWQRSADGLTDWADIASATAETHVLVEDDVASYLRIKVIATNAKGASDPAYSAASGAIAGMSLLTGLVAHWKLNETSGVRYDSTANGYDLTDNNSVGYAAGKMGNAAVFTGTEYLSNPLVSVAGSSAMTASIWIKTSSNNAAQQTFFGSWNFAQGLSPNPCEFMLARYGTTLEAAVALSGGFDNQRDIFGWHGAGPEIADGDWHHLVLVFTGTQILVYCDNVEVYASPTFASDTINVGVPSFMIGNSLQTIFGAVPFEGDLDSASIWSRALSSGDIAALYNTGSGLDYGDF